MTAAILFCRPGAWPAYVAPPVAVPASVSAITSLSATEGAALVYTVTLTATTVGSSTLAYALTGTASGGDVGTPTFSAGVTLAGATLTVPGGVSSFTVTLPAVDDATVEGDETAILTIGGVSSTGTIVDNDSSLIPATMTGGRLVSDKPADWMQTAYDGIVGGGRSQLTPLVPYHGASVGFKRPWFHWPTPEEASDASGDARVSSVSVYTVGGVSPLMTLPAEAGYNFVRATADLSLDVDYEWAVTHPTAGTSARRRFRVRADAVDYAPPTRTSAATVAAAKARPRFGLSAAKITAYTSGSNTASYSRLQTLFNGFEFGAMPADGPSTYAQLQEHARIIACQHLWQITGTLKYKTEGLRRFRNLISWSPTGSIVEPGNDDSYRLHLLTCAIAYDTWGADLTVPQCTQYFDLLGNQLAYLLSGRTSPYSSVKLLETNAPWASAYGRRLWHLALFTGHIHNHLLAACTAACAVVGDEARFTGSHSSLAANLQLFTQASEVILANWEFKSTDDGAYRGGAAYLYTQHLFAIGCDALATCFGVDFWGVPRRKNINTLQPLLHPYYAGRVHDFGDDGAGVMNLSRTYLAFRKKTSQMNALIASAGWAVDDGDYAFHAHFYRDEAADPPVAVPTQLAAWSVDAGIFSTHSSWSDANRVTLKFRSDPAGPFNHSNMRNGSSLLWADGKPLLFDGGRYDYFNSPHQQNFKGVAHKSGNLISLASRAGGQRGYQGSNDSRSVQGGFQWLGSDEASKVWSAVTADNLQSYQQAGYLHTKAKNSVCHIKPGIFVYVDDHALSGTAQTFEANFHTENRQTYTGLAISGNVITATGAHNLPVGVNVDVLVSTPRTIPTSVSVTSNVATWTKTGGHGLPLGSAVPVLISPIAGYGWPAGLAGYFTANVSSSTVFTVPTTGIADGAVSIPADYEPGVEFVMDLTASVSNSTTAAATATGATLTNQTFTGTAYLMFGPSSSGVGSAITIGNGATTATITPLTGTGLSSASAQLLTDNTWGGSNNTTLLAGMCNANSHPLGSQNFQSATQQQHHNYIQYASATSLMVARLLQVQGYPQATGVTASANASTFTMSFTLSGYDYTLTLDRSTGIWAVARTAAVLSPAFMVTGPGGATTEATQPVLGPAGTTYSVPFSVIGPSGANYTV